MINEIDICEFAVYSTRCWQQTAINAVICDTYTIQPAICNVTIMNDLEFILDSLNADCYTKH